MRNSIFMGIAAACLVMACHSKPKVLEGEPMGENDDPPRQTALDMAVEQTESDVHKVEVVEALNTERYTYLNVNEGDKNFWIAIPRKEVEIGGTYYYKGGLLKKNFFSQEFNRVFETVYLVSDVRKQPIDPNGSALDEAMANIQVGGALDEGPIHVEPAAGSIAIAALLKDRQKYEGKVVQITGKCVKVNPMIMGRNWVHIKDASTDTDLTVTTMEGINLGAVVSLEGTIALNKDFGAGYRYDVIMESAVIK